MPVAAILRPLQFNFSLFPEVTPGRGGVNMLRRRCASTPVHRRQEVACVTTSSHGKSVAHCYISGRALPSISQMITHALSASPSTWYLEICPQRQKFGPVWEGRPAVLKEFAR